MSISVFKQIPLKSFSSWFRELAALASENEDSSVLPLIEISMQTGGTVRGLVLKRQKIKFDYQLLMYIPSAAYTQSAVTIVHESNVLSMTVLETDKFIKQFLSPVSTKEISGLELKRIIRSVTEEVNYFFNTPVNITTPAELSDKNQRRDMALLLDLLPAVFEKITADQMGKELINKAVKNIEVTLDNNTSLRLENGILVLCLESPITKPLSEVKAELVERLEKLL